MLASSFRASRQSLARVARLQNGMTFRRTFITPTAVRQADLVQDLYLKELKAYKTPAVKPADAEGHVHIFSNPKPPQSPEEADIASELAAYESQVPEVEGQSAEGGEAAPAESWFDESVFEDEEAHH
ncbi:ATP synthase H chain [Delphinella strobiligena]|nr:ATP synthase H chain [Delphinella strobiligena]